MLRRPSLQICVGRVSSREKGAITDDVKMKDFYAMFEDDRVEALCDDDADPISLARRIAEGINQGRFRMN